MRHEYGTSCNRDECDGSCSQCCLGWCKVCGLFEGSLTTHCPGVSSSREHADRVYAGIEDFRAGEWVRGCTIHMVQHIWYLEAPLNLELISIQDEAFDYRIALRNPQLSAALQSARWLRVDTNWRARFACYGNEEFCEERRIQGNKYTRAIAKGRA